MDRELEIAVRKYRKGAVSLGRAAKLADVSVWRFLDALAECGVEVNYDESDLETDLRAVREADDPTD